MNNLAIILERQGRLQEAEECFELDLALARSIGDLRGEARMLEDLGRCALERGAHVVGLDLDAGALRGAAPGLRARAHELGALGAMLRGDTFQLPFRDETFDKMDETRRLLSDETVRRDVDET